MPNDTGELAKATAWVLVGGGAFAREVHGWLASSMDVGHGRRVRGYVAENVSAGMTRYGVPWLGTPADFRAHPGDALLLCIGNPADKMNVVKALVESGSVFESFIHSSVLVHPTAKIQEGCVVCPGSVISADAVVQAFTTINIVCTVGHDVTIGAYSCLSAHVDLTGGVCVGAGAFFGSGARVVPGVKVGAGARVGAGATVVRNVDDGVTVFTAAAKRL